MIYRTIYVVYNLKFKNSQNYIIYGLYIQADVEKCNKIKYIQKTLESILIFDSTQESGTSEKVENAPQNDF